MENLNSKNLQEQIEDLLYTSIRAYNIKEDDAVSIKTLKLMLVGKVMEGLGLDWTYLINLFKTHTPIHPEIGKELKQIGDEDVMGTISQMFVRNEKLVRLFKVLTQHGKNMDKFLAVDGLGGNITNGPNFDQKHYVSHLRYGNKNDPKIYFDNDPEYKRLHVQTVREMYNMLGDAPVPEKQIYEIVRRCFMEMAKVTLPEIEFDDEEVVDPEVLGDCGEFYMKTMGKENIENLVKSLKRFRGDKRTQIEREDESPSPTEKRVRSDKRTQMEREEDPSADEKD